MSLAPAWTMVRTFRGAPAMTRMSDEPNVPDGQPPGTLVTLAERRRRAIHSGVPIETVQVGARALSLRDNRLRWVVGGRPVNSVSTHPFHGDLVAVMVGGRLTRYTPS